MYERLSFLDNTFLAMEGPNNPMHVAATLLFTEGHLGTAGGGLDIDSIRRFIGNRLQYVPRYRQRLEWVPVERHPVWVDDATFDLGYHVRHVALPRPGNDEQLRTLAGSLLSRALDRSRPMWEIWVVEGLADGGFALVSKVHHCMVDGVGGMDLLRVLLSPDSTDDVGVTEVFEPRPAPTRSQLFTDELARRMRAPRQAVQSVRKLMEESRQVGDELRQRLMSMTASARSGWFSRAAATPLNRKIGPNRRLGFLSTPLDEAKAVKKSHGGTVNDVVITAVAGAVRSFLIEERDHDVSTLDFRAMVPVSTRGEWPLSDSANAVTMWLLDLPVSEPDPLERYRLVRERTDHLKETNQATGAALLTQSASFTPATILSVAARVAAATARPFNMTVTNVPGPQIPLYLLSAQLRHIYPVVPLWVNHGIGVALFSYDGTLDWGIVADWDTVPDVDVFTRHLGRALDELHALSG